MLVFIYQHVCYQILEDHNVDIYGLVQSTVSSWSCVMLNVKISGEWWSGKIAQHCACGWNWGTDLVLAWNNWQYMEHLSWDSLWTHSYPKQLPPEYKSKLFIIQVSQEECARLRECVPYVNPKHLYPKLNGYGDNGQRKVWSSCSSTYCTCSADALSHTTHVVDSGMQSKLWLRYQYFSILGYSYTM
jgi:hypothetical protein